MNTFTFSVTVTDPFLAVEIAQLIKDRESPLRLEKGPVSEPPGLETEHVFKPFKCPGLELPHGERLWHNYKGLDLYASIDDGRIRFGDELFDALSKAADAAGKSADKACHNPNGFKWWNVKRDGKWVPLETVRK